ncbi:DUF6461 domain-containing protein [Jidongwangia harbinensis]|uniref:DUF6461 domain-containing protein n=1 Tax=Jidongwangia harbinensis TaxID=2878561 RepID=UPI001CD9D912|nr:DUF6461 domain-containing protein [Jidongwangia harbinensis]MCA2215705.1 DUF6461 domain-containing protein [Jidongwangia harbinensis]
MSAQGWDSVALCFTYAKGLDEAALITAFGGDPSATMPQAELFETLAGFHYSRVPAALLVADLGGWCVGIEPNGYQGSRPEVLRRAAVGGAAVSVYWNVNATNAFSYATGGRTVVGFDMLDPQSPYGADPHILDAEMADLRFGGEIFESYVAGLVLAERVTGVRLPADLPQRELVGAVLKKVPEDLVPEHGAGHPALGDPFVQQVLAVPTADKLRAIDGFLARLVAEDSGVIEEPVIRASVEAFRDGELAAGLRDALLAVQERYRATHRATLQLPVADRGNALELLHAVQDVVAALLPDQRRLGRDSVRYRSYQLRDTGRSLQAYVLEQCAVRAKYP